MLVKTGLERRLNNLVAQKPDSTEVVTTEERAHSNMFQVEVLTRILVKKGIMTKEEGGSPRRGIKSSLSSY